MDEWIVKYPYADIAAYGRETPAATALPLAALATGFILAMLDVTIVNVALTDIASTFGASLSGLVWVVDGYTLTFAALMLAGGALADRIGPRAAYLSGLAIFTLASVACGLAWDTASLVGARLVQGVGAALFIPSSLSLLVHTYADEAVRARMVALWSAIVTLSVAAGPVVGGLLISRFGWRSAFLVNLPIGLVGALLTVRLVQAAPRRPRPLNLGSHALGIVVLTALSYFLIQGPERGWGAPAVWSAAAIATLGCCLLLWQERRTSVPLVPRELLSRPEFVASAGIGFLANFSIYGQLFLAALYLQQSRGATPLETGLQLLPLMGVLAAGNLLSGRISSGRGTRFPLRLGLGLASMAAACAAALGAESSHAVFLVLLTAGNLGVAIAIPALTATVMRAGGQDHANSASAVLNANRQIGTLVGIAAMGSVLHALPGWGTGLRVALALIALGYAAAWTIALRGLRSDGRPTPAEAAPGRP